MAHAAPVMRAPSRTGRTPDVFSDRTHRIAAWAVPVTLGLIYGYWVAANNRSGEAITGWNVLLGFVSAIVFAALWMGIHALAPHVIREVHALIWAAFAGCAFGFLYSETGASVLRSAGMGVAIGASTFGVLFYRYYTHEDAEGRRIR
ncbi:hypothetical protein [Streptomyces sp. Amel2xC10]|uniref:hypothetical protein n=1 Tax=Streptomyces sp. Amel2xC10 TaxID=1305826 RepID=UPI000A085489|nr:hypothetical protein [Streptomyces sp. Amel2xC10]SMF62108.1 hypothetical protein SAMN02745830_04775 [Streptomyces sp. Amel2xC10]